MKHQVTVPADAETFFANLEAELNQKKDATHPDFHLYEGHMPRKQPDFREILEGTIVGKNRDVFFVSVPGMGSDAFLPFSEVVSELAIGQTLPLQVTGMPDNFDEGILLSEKRAIAWMKLMQAKEDGAVVEVTVNKVISKGPRIQGLQVICEGVIGFIPRSQMADYTRLDEAVGTTLAAKVIKADPVAGRRGELVFSNKQAAEQAVDAYLSELQAGQVVNGTVKKILTSKDGKKEIGALINIADSIFTAFLHRSEISDSHSTNPSDVLEVGQTIEVEILSIDRESREAKLTYKRLLHKKTFETLKEGAVVNVEVLRFRDRVGYFVAIGEGFTALLPCSQVSERRNAKVGDAFKAGQRIDVVVISVDAEGGRAIVSYKEHVLSNLKEGDVFEGRVTGVQPHIGVFVTYGPVEGLLHRSELPYGERPEDYNMGDTVKVQLKKVNKVDERTLIAWSRKSADTDKRFTGEVDGSADENGATTSRQ